MAFLCNAFRGFPSKFWVCKTAVSLHATTPPLHLQSACVVPAQGFVLSTDCESPLQLRVCKSGNGPSASGYPQEFHRGSGHGTQSVSQ